MIQTGAAVRVVAAMCQDWPDPEDRRAESDIVSRYVGRRGVVARIDEAARPVPYTIRFGDPPVWGAETMPSEMRFRGFELEEEDG